VTDYQPGVCNIGRRERRLRRVAGLLSFAVAAALTVAAVTNAFPGTTLWGAAPFVFGGFLGLLQDRLRFCVAFAALARYDLAGSGGASGRVEDGAALRADRRRALKLLALSAVGTAATMAGLLALV